MYALDMLRGDELDGTLDLYAYSRQWTGSMLRQRFATRSLTSGMMFGLPDVCNCVA